MKLIDKLLRFPLAPEVLALLEKIDSIDSVYDASYQPIERLIEDAGFSRYERRILKKSLSKISRRHAYSCAMHVVIKNELPSNPYDSAMNKHLAQINQRAFAAQQAQSLTNGGLASYTGLNPQGQIAHGLHSTDPYKIYRNAQQ